MKQAHAFWKYLVQRAKIPSWIQVTKTIKPAHALAYGIFPGAIEWIRDRGGVAGGREFGNNSSEI